MDGGLPNANQLEFVPPSSRLLIVVAVENAKRCAICRLQVRTVIFFSTGSPLHGLARIAPLFLRHVLALDIDDDPRALRPRHAPEVAGLAPFENAELDGLQPT